MISGVIRFSLEELKSIVISAIAFFSRQNLRSTAETAIVIHRSIVKILHNVNLDRVNDKIVWFQCSLGGVIDS